MRDSIFFTEQADACRTAADAATLSNVREQCLRAEAAWQGMAARSLRSEAARERRGGPDAGPIAA